MRSRLRYQIDSIREREIIQSEIKQMNSSYWFRWAHSTSGTWNLWLRLWRINFDRHSNDFESISKLISVKRRRISDLRIPHRSATYYTSSMFYIHRTFFEQTKIIMSLHKIHLNAKEGIILIGYIELYHFFSPNLSIHNICPDYRVITDFVCVVYFDSSI